MNVTAEGIAGRQIPSPGTLRLDHVAHFVPDIDAAAAALEGLGLVLTPLSAQTTRTDTGASVPACTASRCVMLEDGYLQFLTPVAHRRLVRAAIERHADTHWIALGTPAAEEEHARLARHGYAPLPLLELEQVYDTGGEKRLARFAVVRVTPQAMPEGHLQFVQQMTPERLWRAPWLAHASSVTGLRCAFVVADHPAEVAARYGHFAGLLPQPVRGFVRLCMAHGEICVGGKAACKALFGDVPSAAPAMAGYGLTCRQPEALRERLRAARCQVMEPSPGLYAAVLPAALGSAWLFGTPGAFADWLSPGGC